MSAIAARRTNRKEEILRILQDQGTTSVVALAQELNASQATLRRDLHSLEQSGLIERHAGKVGAAFLGDGELPMSLRSAMYREEKQRIAAKALELVQNGETIIISGGSTTLELAHQLSQKPLRLNVITNSLYIADILADRPRISLVVLGGEIRSGERTAHGHLTESGAQELRADKFFYGIQAISLQHGLTHNQLIEVNTDRALAASALQVILLADHSKFGKVAPAVALPLNRVHTIITGVETPEDVAVSIQEQGPVVWRV